MPNSADPNDITLASYNAEVESYIKHTPDIYQEYHGLMLRWINSSLQMLRKEHKILEIGSGSGRDAGYIRSQGFNITCSDAAPAFVSYLRSKGWDAKTLNILKDEVPKGFTMIFANAVIPHFTPKQFNIVLTKVLKALPPGGLFVFNTKQGHGEDWITEKFDAKRFIHYWDPKLLKRAIERSNCKILLWEEDIPGNPPSHVWTNVIIQKRL